MGLQLNGVLNKKIHLFISSKHSIKAKFNSDPTKINTIKEQKSLARKLIIFMTHILLTVI